MVFKSSKLKELEALYEESGNQLLVLYGQQGVEKEALLKSFVKDKKCFYYRARQASADRQKIMMSEEISNQYDVRLITHEYKEIFNRIKSGDASKLVVVIDEFQYIAKKDPQFLIHIEKLKKKKYYPGPVMIILATSSIVFAEQDLKEMWQEQIKSVNRFIKIDYLNFLEVVRAFPEYHVSDTIKFYGVMGGVPEYINHWNTKLSFKENICNLVLKKDGYLFSRAEMIISSELRELSVYNTILACIAAGNNKLNDLFHITGYSRAKISVYMKNLSHFDIVEKVVNFESGGWDNAQKGMYQIKDTYINFWYKFVYPHLSDLYWMSESDFYDTYIKNQLNTYLSRYFRSVCMEYLVLLEQVGQLPITITKIGTWIGKEGNIDIVAQNAQRENVVAYCNFEQAFLTMEMINHLFKMMKMAKISSKHIYLFSANAFSDEVKEMAANDSRFELIDMNEL